MATSFLFHRKDIATQMASQLLSPGILDANLRSGVFLSGQRRIGKTTFLKQDLIPELENRGAIVIYVDLWSDIQVNPATLLQNAIKAQLQELETPGSSILGKLKRVKGVDLGGMGFKLGINLETLGREAGMTLADAFCRIVDIAKTDVVLIVDEVQQAITTEEGNKLLLALKAVRDAVNGRPVTPGYFLFLGTGSHRAKVHELVVQRNQAFLGATTVDYPLLGIEYTQHVLEVLVASGIASEKLPSLDVLHAGFVTLGQRPEELLRAIRELLKLDTSRSPDEAFPIVAATMRSTLADLEISKLEGLGTLALVVFDRVAQKENGAKGLYSAEALAAYRAALEREVGTEEVQAIINVLQAENLIMRSGHGMYAVADPFVQALWNERKLLPID